MRVRNRLSMSVLCTFYYKTNPTILSYFFRLLSIGVINGSLPTREVYQYHRWRKKYTPLPPEFPGNSPGKFLLPICTNRLFSCSETLSAILMYIYFLLPTFLKCVAQNVNPTKNFKKQSIMNCTLAKADLNKMNKKSLSVQWQYTTFLPFSHPLLKNK